MKRGPQRKLAVEQQAELLELLKLRQKLTNKALALRFAISPSGVAAYRRRLIAKSEAPGA
jgi:DNA-binding CsgD family transcriptional regulator